MVMVKQNLIRILLSKEPGRMVWDMVSVSNNIPNNSNAIVSGVVTSRSKYGKDEVFVQEYKDGIAHGRQTQYEN